MRNVLSCSAVALLLSSACATSDAPAPSSSEPRPSSSRQARAAEVAPDLEGMLTPVPEYAGNGRNLFAFGPPRSAAGPTNVTETVAPPPVAPPPTTPILTPRPPTAPAGARLALKYAGFLEKTGPDGGKAKYAIFLDGNEILAGREGEFLGNRFTVVEIGLESVTVSTRDSTTTQRIPLQSN